MYTISSAENDIRQVTQIYALVTLKYLYISTFYYYYYYYIYYCVYHVTTSIECSGYNFNIMWIYTVSNNQHTNAPSAINDIHDIHASYIEIWLVWSAKKRN
ncbi:hypothetical protein CPL00221_CDS0029 [Escherichia phage RobRod40]